ncbi:ABC transporter permease [Bradyrhizobium amphicarpaeae]|nr:ABC transporter permease [Bradyrhizobium amphicarpaeae]
MAEAEVLAVAGSWVAAMLRSSTPLMMVTLGETLTQRVGIVNLGVEGQMLGGACVGFSAAAATGSPVLGFAAGAAAGLLLSLVHAALCLGCNANQIGSGIAVFTLGLGLSSFFGRGAIGGKVTGLDPLAGSGYVDVPLVGPILTQLTPIAPLAIVIVLVAGAWLYRTRTGLNWRIVGESFQTARALGIRPMLIQTQGILAGGLLSGFAGAILSVDYTQTWADEMTKGRGFVAVGLVIVARWNPFLVLPVTLLFGVCEAATLRLQATGLTLSPYLISCLPYVASVICVIVVSVREGRLGGMPAELASVFGRRS